MVLRLMGAAILAVVVACVTLSPGMRTAAAQEADKKPLAATDIEKLLHAGVTQGRVADLIDQRGVDFEISTTTKEQLRSAGANDEVMGAVERASVAAAQRKLDEERRTLESERKAGEAGPAAEKQPQPADAAAKKTAEKQRPPREGKSPAAGGQASGGKVTAPDQGTTGMVAVLGGPFFMGCSESVDSECEGDEKPGKTVEVGSIRTDKTEVTVAEFAKCVDAGHCSSAGLLLPFSKSTGHPQRAELCNWSKPGRENHPINCVDWEQAVAYCAWNGKRLPSEPEWEKAARGTDGRKYPWGNTGYGSGTKVANIADESAKREGRGLRIARGYDDGYLGTAPVGSFPAGSSPYGALDMIGNVAEWTADSFGDGRAVRGASWNSGPRGARASFRGSAEPTSRHPFLGFRCAR